MPKQAGPKERRRKRNEMKTAHDWFYGLPDEARMLLNLDGWGSKWGKQPDWRLIRHDWYYTPISKFDFFSKLWNCTHYTVHHPLAHLITPFEPFNGRLRRSSRLQSIAE
jgi:hypothetical protein